MIESALSITLMIRATLMFVVTLFLLVGGTLAWYEVQFYGKNGLTVAIRNFLYAIGLVFLTSTIMTFYASLSSIQTVTFLIISLFSTYFTFILLYSIYKLVNKVMIPDKDNE